MILTIFFASFSFAVECQPIKAKPAYVEKFTNYSPTLRGINGRCGTSASGKDACAYFLEDFLEGKTKAVMGAVPQKGGTGDLFGGYYQASALQNGLGVNQCIVVFAGDRYAKSSNNLSKMDIVTREAKSAPALRVNNARGELLPLGRAPNLPAPSRTVARDPQATAPVKEANAAPPPGETVPARAPPGSTTAADPDSPYTQTQETYSNVPIPYINSQPTHTPPPSTPGSTPISVSESIPVQPSPSPVPSDIGQKLICPLPSSFAKQIYNCGKNEVAVQVAQSCAKILGALLQSKSNLLAKEMMEANKTANAGQTSSLLAAKARLTSANQQLLQQIGILQQNNATLASYTTSMIDFADGKDDKTSADCYSRNYHSLQNVVSGLDKEIILAKNTQTQASLLIQNLGSAKLSSPGSSTPILNGNNANSAPPAAKATDNGDSTISPNSLPKN